MGEKVPSTIDRRTLFEWSRSIFQNEDDHHAWWGGTHPMLHGQTPWEAASTCQGATAVRNILVALRYGGVA